MPLYVPKFHNGWEPPLDVLQEAPWETEGLASLPSDQVRTPAQPHASPELTTPAHPCYPPQDPDINSTVHSNPCNVRPAWLARACDPLSSMVLGHSTFIKLLPCARLIMVPLAQPVTPPSPSSPLSPQMTPMSRLSTRHSPKHSISSDIPPEDIAPPGSSPHTNR